MVNSIRKANEFILKKISTVFCESLELFKEFDSSNAETNEEISPQSPPSPKIEEPTTSTAIMPSNQFQFNSEIFLENQRLAFNLLK